MGTGVSTAPSPPDFLLSKECDGVEVPLVWNHDHSNPDNVLGKVLLKNTDEGVYCYGSFNDTTKGQIAKTLVAHGDITNL